MFLSKDIREVGRWWIIFMDRVGREEKKDGEKKEERRKRIIKGREEVR